MSNFHKNDKNGVIFYRSEVILCPHAFSTREGGASTIPHLSSMNVGYGLGDDENAVSENRRRLAAAIGAEAANIISAKQIHSNIVLTVGETDIGRRDLECDGFVTRERGIALMIKTADCVPILMHEPESSIIAAVHAGWRGTALDIAGEAVRRICELGGRAEYIRCAIGHAIRQCCYEVDKQFYDKVAEARGADFAERFIIPDGNGRYHTDLPQMNEYLLRLSGVRAENIDISEHCTCCDPDHLFSHRASGGKRGVMGAMIVQPEK